MDSNRAHPSERHGWIIHHCASQHKPNSFLTMDGYSSINHFPSARDHVVTKQAFVDGVVPVRRNVPNSGRVVSVGGGERCEQGSILMGEVVLSLVLRMGV